MGALGFASPFLLIALIALPLIWWLLRAVPPAAIKRRFPAVSLLLGLDDTENTPNKTPWWLLMLRMLALAALIIGFAGPILNPADRSLTKTPLLIAMDASWSAANSWDAQQAKLKEILSQADRAGRPVALVRLTDSPQDEGRLPFGSARDAMARVDGLTPAPYAPQFDAWSSALTDAENNAFDTRWFSDGLANEDRAELFELFKSKGDIEVYHAENEAIIGIRPPRIEAGTLVTDITRVKSDTRQTLTLDFIGPDPAGITRRLATGTATFESGTTDVSSVSEIPSELRNRVERVVIRNHPSASATSLTDDSIQRRKVALIGAVQEQEGSALTAPLHFLRKALVPTADVIEASLEDIFAASADVIIMADVGTLPQGETQQIIDWVNDGGLLLRFAGPRLASSDLSTANEHPLLPVRLRAGGRSVGGAMSWGEPKSLRKFAKSSPFFGLKIPDDVVVKSQVMAQPDPTLADRVLASLWDGTPLVTAKDMGLGRVVLFHVTSNAAWSTLPLSGLFVEMLERLAISTRETDLTKDDLAGLIWQPEIVLDGFGAIEDATQLAGVEGDVLALGIVGEKALPGVYLNGARKVAFNVIGTDTVLTSENWPLGTSITGLNLQEEKQLKPLLLTIALILFALDGIATLLMTGGVKRRHSAIASALCLIMFSTPQVRANDADILAATTNTILAYVKTGNTRLDTASAAGMLGLTAELFRRTSIEPIAPMGVDIAVDELSVYPFLYWPISEDQADLSDNTISKLNAYLRFGGMILFDTRDADLGRSFTGTVNGRKLQQIANRLEIPALEPIPKDHVLTRSFYLLQDFPGRYAGYDVWAEAAPSDAVQIEGMPFRNLNDGVTPVVIGGNDWASAWAIDENGSYMFPVGRGFDGDRQREISFRFGVNLIMHVMTGNYKSDQVHVPALLKRLGQ